MGIRERKEREKERRRQQIVVAAKRVFATKGFGRATMEDIANEAELSPGTLYLYFKSKDDLCASLSLRVLEYFVLRMEHLNQENEELDEKSVHRIKNALLDVYEFDPLILKNLYYMQSQESMHQLSPEIIDDIDTLRNRALEKISVFFKGKMDSGTIVKSDPMKTAKITWAMFYGIILWHTSEGKQAFQSILDRCFEIFEHGILN